MIIRTIQWNIGGGLVRYPNDDPTAEDSYQKEDLIHIGGLLKRYRPDIIFTQETHQSSSRSQIKVLADALKLEYYFNDVYDRSHINSTQELGQGIISKWPIKNHQFELFINPRFEVLRPNGEKWISHNKGVSSCIIQVESKTVNLKTLHLIPFRKFNQNPLSEELKEVRQDIEDKIKPEQELFLLQGDFNWNDFSLKEFLPGIFNENIQEVILAESTTPKGRKYDHIIFKGLRHKLSKVITNALTDHYPIYSEFEI